MNHQERRLHHRAIATEFLDKINSVTVCSVCGGSPVEWHHDDHPDNPNSRVSSLRTQGASIPRIQKEIDRCTPLCRLCHMKEDGRLDALRTNQPQQKGMVYVPPRPCEDCGKLAKPTRRGRCWSCYVKLMEIR